mgnify:CR=1 FL=1
MTDNILNIPIQSLKTLHKSLNYIRTAKLWLQVLIAMFLGIACGWLLSPSMGLVSSSTADIMGEWLALPGRLFLALIQMIVVPLIFTSILQGIAAAGDIKKLKKTGLSATFFFMSTTVLAVILGISVGIFFKPGQYIDTEKIVQSDTAKAKIAAIQEQSANQSSAEDVSPLKQLPAKFTGILPKNPIHSIAQGDMLQIVIFAIIFGLGMLLLKPESARPILDLTGSIQEVSMQIVGIAMSFAPLAVFGLLAQSVITTGPESLLGIGIYALAVIGALALLYIFYIFLAFALGRVSPIVFLKAIREPTLIGFSTNSSAATMPITVKSAEEGLKIPTSLSQFVIPLGATINMGGTACYQGLTTLFMAQIYGLDLSISALTALIVTAVGASIGTPAVPGVGIIVLSGVLSSAGIPLAGLPLILGADRILERFRTSLNVTGDLAACVVLNRFIKSPNDKTDG